MKLVGWDCVCAGSKGKNLLGSTVSEVLRNVQTVKYLTVTVSSVISVLRWTKLCRCLKASNDGSSGRKSPVLYGSRSET